MRPNNHGPRGYECAWYGRCDFCSTLPSQDSGERVAKQRIRPLTLDTAIVRNPERGVGNVLNLRFRHVVSQLLRGWLLFRSMLQVRTSFVSPRAMATLGLVVCLGP